MSANDNVDVIVRLKVDGSDLDKKLTPAAQKAEKAIDGLTTSARKANPALNALDDTINGGKAGLESYASQIPIVGDGLVSLGTAGIAAGVGLAAVTAAAVVALKAGAEAAREIAAIGDTAEDIGLAADAYQALVFVTAQQRQEQTELNSILKTANKNLGESVLGTGEFVSKAGLLNKELVKQVASADTLADKLALVSKAYQAASTENERLQILTATFGDSNLFLAKTLLEYEGGLEGAITKAREFGVVHEDSLIIAAQSAASKLELADLRITASKQRLGITFADEAAGMKSAWAGFLDFLAGDEGELLKLTIDDQVIFLQEKIAEQEEILATANKFNSQRGLTGEFNNFNLRTAEQEKEALEGKIRLITLLDAATQESIVIQKENREQEKVAASVLVAFNRLTEEAETKINQRTEAEKALQAAIDSELITDEKEIARLKKFIAEKYKDVEAIRDAAKAQKEFVRRSKQVAEVQAKIGDVAAKVAIKEKQLNDLRAAGLKAKDKNVLSQKQINETLRDYERRINGAAAAEKRLTAAFERSLAPLASYNNDLKKLTDQQTLANIPAAQFNAILAARKKLYDDQVKAANEARETEQFGETLAEAEKRILNAVKTSEEVIDAKIALQEKILEALAAKISADDAAKFLKEYREELEGAAEETDKLTDAQTRFDNILNQQIRTWEDLEDVALSALQEIIKQLIIGQKEGEGFGGFLSAILGGKNGTSGSFGRSSGGDFSGGLGGVLASIFHDGTPSVGKSGYQRSVSAADVISAPRYHRGKSSIGTDEQVAVLQQGERVTSRSDSRALIDAINFATARSFETSGSGQIDIASAVLAASRVFATSAAPASAANSGGLKLSVIYDGQPANVEAEDKGVDGEGMRQIELKMLTVGRVAARQVLADGSADGIMRTRFGIHRAGQRR